MRVLIVDPDARNYSGHYMAYNEKLTAELAKSGASVYVACRKDINVEVLSCRDNYIPIFSDHSWDVGNRSRQTNSFAVFCAEIDDVIRRLSQDDPNLLVYMYCGSLEHAKALAEIKHKYPGLRVNMNLFWTSFQIERNPDYLNEWKEFLSWLEGNTQNFIATLPTLELRDKVASLTGVMLNVAPHPSTGLSDNQFRESNFRRDLQRSNPIKVLFPGAPRFEKGYQLSIDAMRLLGNDPRICTIIRHAPNASSPKEFSDALGTIPTNATVVHGELSNAAFLELFAESDVVVLPYGTAAFAMRTSGLLIDAIYHGLPCVVLAGTWLATLVHKYDCGIVVQNATASSISSAVSELINRLDHYTKRTRIAAEAYFSKNSWAELSDFILLDGPNRKSQMTFLANETMLKTIKDRLFSAGLTNDFAPPRQKIAIVMGNGPSSKLLDFEQLRIGHVATVGMNAAYRYWDQIDFRPTYYICMDPVVIQSHAKQIVRLIEEGRIQNFFLRDELKIDHPELANSERILWYGEARNKSELFRTNFVTTGSWAIRWMLYEGMRVISTIGIDANYTEILAEAKRTGSGSDVGLEIAKTPRFNPNYFFNDYQRVGDKYNIPNSPEYLKKAGGLVHVDSLKAISKDMSKLNISSRIIDLSPISSHGVFEKQNLGAFLQKIRLAVLTSFRVSKDVKSDILVAITNCENPLVSQLCIMLEGAREDLNLILDPSIGHRLSKLEANGRLHIAEINKRPSFKDIFNYANANFSNSVIVTNSDILIPHSTAEKAVIDRFSDGQPLYALTRWNLTENGVFIQGLSATPPWIEMPVESLENKDKNFFSFDSYIFDTPIRVPEAAGKILFGSLGCDTALVGVLKVTGHKISNPCLSYQTIHMDDKVRDYQGDRGRYDLFTNISALRHSIFARYANRDGVKSSLERSDRLHVSVAWVGHPKSMGTWHSLLRALGASSWSSGTATVPYRFKKMGVTKADLECSRLDGSKLIKELKEGNVFWEWELSGFDKGDHFANLLLAHEKYKHLGIELEKYQWQSVIHLDRATTEERTIYSDVLLAIQDILLANDSGKDIDLAALVNRTPILGPYIREEMAHVDESYCVAALIDEKSTSGVMVDVGAHHGGAMKPFLEIGWAIYAFEPDSNNREELLRRISQHPLAANVRIDDRAVSDKSAKNLKFYRSDESSGISGLSAFHYSHKSDQVVDAVTLIEALSDKAISAIDFLKIDTEGFDIFVLKGFPWDRFKPAVIECEFEDAKTIPLGYTFHDLAQLLVDKGYVVYVSEWHPIIRYGIRHSWNRLVPYPCELSDSRAWGNLLAFRAPINQIDLVAAMKSTLKVGAAQGATVSSSKKAYVAGKPATQEKLPSTPVASVSKTSFRIQTSQFFTRIGPQQWLYNHSGAPQKIWFAAVDSIDQTAGRMYVGGLRLKSDHDMAVSVSLGRHGKTDYEGINKRVTLAKGVAHDVKLTREFVKSHPALKLQVDVIDLKKGGSALLTIDGLYLYELLTSVQRRVGEENVTLREANRLFRAGDFSAAMGVNLLLHQRRPMKIYSDNALMAARKLGMIPAVATVEQLLRRVG